MKHLFSRYVKALEKEIIMLTSGSPGDPLATIFFGGGTPSLLSIEDISSLLQVCKKRFRVDEHAEISMEINPKTVDFVKLLTIYELGINRISVGVQSFSDKELQLIGRLHNAQEAMDAVESVYKSGITNFNIDLISGLPGQSVDSWNWSLQAAIALHPNHLSLYQLSIEEETNFNLQLQKGTLVLPKEEEILRMDEITSDLCGSAGIQQYEISNFAKPGFECRHNINYWQNGEYFGVGAGAVRYLAGERQKNIADPLIYCQRLERGESVVHESELLDAEASFRESVVMGLRMNEGVSSDSLFSRYGINLQTYYGTVMDRLLHFSLVEFRGIHLCLTRKGRLLANQVMADLV
jgi:oxygen-independent coproporphyrinogen III oxidase